MTGSSKRTIFLVRHAQRHDKTVKTSEWRKENDKHVDDSPLSWHGFEQARALGARLAKEHLDAIFISPLVRCVQTTFCVLEQRSAPHPPVYVEPGLMETLSSCQEKPTRLPLHTLKLFLPAIDSNYQKVVKRKELRRGEAEGVFKCDGRVRRTLEGILQRVPQGGRILIVTHGGPASAIHQALTGQWTYQFIASLSCFIEGSTNAPLAPPLFRNKQMETLLKSLDENEESEEEKHFEPQPGWIPVLKSCIKHLSDRDQAVLRHKDIKEKDKAELRKIKRFMTIYKRALNNGTEPFRIFATNTML